MRKYNAPYKGDTRGWRIFFNTLYRFKAMGGHWYAIDGIFTGEYRLAKIIGWRHEVDEPIKNRVWKLGKPGKLFPSYPQRVS